MPAWIRIPPTAANRLLGGAVLGICALLFGSALYSSRTLIREPSVVGPLDGPRIQFDAEGRTTAVRALFGLEPGPAPVVTAAPGSLALHGTLSYPDTHKGYAIISVAGTSRLYAIGDDLGGAALEEVYADHVVLRRGASLESLAMAKPDQSFILGGNTAAPGAHGASEGPVLPPSPEEVNRRVARATAPVAAFITAHAKMNGSDYRSLVVQPGPDSATFAAIGLRPGDEIMAINGQQVNPDTLGLLTKYVRLGKPIRAYINRAGEDGPREFTLKNAGIAVAAPSSDSDP